LDDLAQNTPKSLPLAFCLYTKTILTLAKFFAYCSDEKHRSSHEDRIIKTMPVVLRYLSRPENRK